MTTCTVITRQTQNHRDLDTVAVVIRSGFSTIKGKLVRSILYPSPVDFKFEQDSYKFVGFLTFLAGIGFGYTVYRLIGTKGVKDIFLDAADLITIVIPPALPAAITIGSLYAENRLKRKGIYCISPRTINVSGSVNCVCFDKTGTLTEDGLDLMGVVQIKK
jgi:cation-transporting ATPase 13A3/4/5